MCSWYEDSKKHYSIAIMAFTMLAEIHYHGSYSVSDLNTFTGHPYSVNYCCCRLVKVILIFTVTIAVIDSILFRILALLPLLFRLDLASFHSYRFNLLRSHFASFSWSTPFFWKRTWIVRNTLTYTSINHFRMQTRSNMETHIFLMFSYFSSISRSFSWVWYWACRSMNFFIRLIFSLSIFWAMFSIHSSSEINWFSLWM